MPKELSYRSIVTGSYFPKVTVSRTVWFGTSALFLLVLTGCFSSAALLEARDLPTKTTVLPVEKDQVSFDESIGAYRAKSNGDEPGAVIRDAAGRKIRTEAQLERWSEASTAAHNSIWTPGAKISGIALAIVYVPIGIVVGVAEAIVAIPVEIYVVALARKMSKRSESMYRHGREQFETANYAGALADWDEALANLPSLRSDSDIDYWRGRAFEALGEHAAARAAYWDFADYSERSTPKFFEGAPYDDPSWKEKAEDAEARSAALLKGV